MPTFIIDQREIEARDGESVLQAAKRHGIDIPHFCWHDKLSVAGNCRMCLVKVNGMAKLQPSCNLVPTPKMTIETAAPEVQRAREQVLQFVLLNHPVDCGICDKAGECRLQDYQHKYGPAQSRSRDAKHHKRKLYPLSERISLDNERCILCSRCVRFTREISKSNALGIVERGHGAYVETVGGRPFDDPYSDNVIGLCPTGALLSRDFLYQCRVWFLEPVRSTCTGCARACNVTAWRRKKERMPHMPGAVENPQAYRITPVENAEIGGGWLCNKGFDLHKAMARERVSAARVDGRPVPTSEALARLQTLLAGAQRPAVLVSTHASNEEVAALVTHWGARVAAYPHTDHVPAPGEVVEDAFLIRGDKNPNRRGVEARIGAARFDPSAHDLVVLWGDVTQPLPFAGGPWIHLAPFGTPTDAPAAVVVPISTTFERSGSFENFEGVPSRFDAVLAPPRHVVHAADVFAQVAP